jgi:site-specific recombinase XerD
MARRRSRLSRHRRFLSSRRRDALAAVKQLVLNAVSSPLTCVMYARTLEDFFAWWNGQGRPPFTRATVQAWRAALEAKGLAPASVNQKLSAVRKLAAEASYNGLLDPITAQAVRDIRGAEQHGIRTGNWLTKGEAETLLALRIRRPTKASATGRSWRSWWAAACGATKPPLLTMEPHPAA